MQTIVSQWKSNLATKGLSLEMVLTFAARISCPQLLFQILSFYSPQVNLGVMSGFRLIIIVIILVNCYCAVINILIL